MTILYGEDAERLAKELENSCSSEEMQRRSELAGQVLAHVMREPANVATEQLETLRPKLARLEWTFAEWGLDKDKCDFATWKLYMAVRMLLDAWEKMK